MARKVHNGPYFLVLGSIIEPHAGRPFTEKIYLKCDDTTNQPNDSLVNACTVLLDLNCQVSRARGGSKVFLPQRLFHRETRNARSYWLLLISPHSVIKNDDHNVFRYDCSSCGGKVRIFSKYHFNAVRASHTVSDEYVTFVGSHNKLHLILLLHSKTLEMWIFVQTSEIYVL